MTADIPAVAAKPQTGLHLDFLDGIRGFAAIYVMQYHILDDIDGKYDHSHLLTHWLTYGHYAVAIFIVLSGYCLMLPVARSDDGQLRGGIGEYLRRRAWRIIPPYYVALAFVLLQIAVTQVIKHTLHQGTSDWWVFSPANLLLHITLLHNLSYEYRLSIDLPMWSIGLEWQIYFLFPLLLLPLWRRFGALATALISLYVTILPSWLLPASHSIDYVNLWLVGLFALGMAGAASGFSERLNDRALFDRISWRSVPILFAMGFLLIALRADKRAEINSVIFEDVIVGITTTCLIVYCARRSLSASDSISTSGKRPAILRLLASPRCVWLGKFSYSLYLMHLPIWWLIQPVMRALHFHGFKQFLFQLFVGMPLAVLGSYIFYLIVERRFTSPPMRNQVR